MTTPAAKTMVDESTDTDMANARTNFRDAKTASNSLASPTYVFERRQARLLRAIFGNDWLESLSSNIVSTTRE
jgi:hypothetical protein